MYSKLSGDDFILFKPLFMYYKWRKVKKLSMEVFSMSDNKYAILCVINYVNGFLRSVRVLYNVCIEKSLYVHTYPAQIAQHASHTS